jgi:hypothetical protein
VQAILSEAQHTGQKITTLLQPVQIKALTIFGLPTGLLKDSGPVFL